MYSSINTPKGWKIKRMPEVVKWSSGGTPKSTVKEYYENGDIPWLVIGDLNNGIILSSTNKITSLGLQNSSAKMVPAGTLLVAMYGSIGKLGITGIDCCTNQAIAFAKELYGVTAKYMFYYLMLIRSELISKGKGGTQKNISLTVLNSFNVIVPSLDEQHRIVSRIEELFSQLDASVATMRKVKEQLGVYRQAVITTSFPSIPESEWVRLDSISTIIGGITKGRDLTGYETIELPYLRVANVQNGYLDLTEMKTITLKKEEKEHYLLKEGDVLYTEGGDRDKLGRGTVWHNEIPECVHQNHVFKARIHREKAKPEYVAYWSMSTPARNYFFQKGKQSVNLASINKSVLSALTLPLPPLEDQDRVIQEIEARLSACDDVERTVDVTMQQAEAMRQSILKIEFTEKGDRI